MGIVSTFPREMIFAPKKKQGLNIHHPFYWQIVSQILILAKHYKKKTITGQLIKAEWEALYQTIGLEGNMEEWPWEIIDTYASQKTWIGKLINFSKEHNIDITITNPKNNTRNNNSLNEETIMKEIIKAGIVGEDL